MRDDSTLGARIRSVRKRRGLSQQELARTASVSISLIKKLEQDYRTDVRTETALKLAKALRVPTTMLLTRHPDNEQTSGDTAGEWAPVHRALAGQVPQLEEEATAEGVTAAMRDLSPALATHQYSVARDLLPALIRDADALDEERSRQVHADLLTTVGYLLIQTRQFAEGELALQRAIDVATDRLDAAASADTLVWAYLRQGMIAEARGTATKWADDLEPRFSRARILEFVMWGRFLLDITNAAVRDNRPGEADDALQLAGAAAARMGREARRHANSQCVFGPVTAAYIRAETMVLTGHPDRCLSIAESLPAAPPYPELVSRLRHRLDVANALAQMHRYPDALTVMHEVSVRAPQWLAHQQYARDILSHIVQRRRTLTPPMRELADAVHLPL